MKTLRPCPERPNCVFSLAKDAKHAIAPLRFSSAPDVAWRKLKSTLESRKNMHIVEESGWYLHSEASSWLFRFVDDLEFVMHPEAQTIHFRSASRRGYADFGVNRRRMESIRKEFQK